MAHHRGSAVPPAHRESTAFLLGALPGRRDFAGIPREQGQGFPVRQAVNLAQIEGLILVLEPSLRSPSSIPGLVCGTLRDVAIAVARRPLDHFLLDDLLMSKLLLNALDPR